MNMILIYKDIMSPIEMLSNSHRLPVPNSLIYETNLLESMVAYFHNASEFEAYLEDGIKMRIKYSDHPQEIPSSNIIKIKELLTDPLSVCQFHVIGVSVKLVNF